MNILRSMSIRSQIIYLIVLMTLLPLGIIIYIAVERQQYEINEAIEQTNSVANQIENNQKILLTEVEQLGATMSILPVVKKREASTVSSMLSKLVKTTPHVTNIVFTDRDGSLWASAIPVKKSLLYTDRKYFQNAVDSGRISSGEYTLSKISQTPVISFGYPIKDSTDNVSDVMAVVFSLDSLSQLYNGSKSTLISSILLVDHEGTILYSSVDAKLVGKKDRSDLFARMSAGTNTGTFEGKGNLGVKRIFSYRKLWLRGESSPYMYIRTGLDKDSVLTKSRKDLMLGAGVLLPTMLIMLGIATYFSKHFILNKVSALLDATHKIARGELSARVPTNITSGEIGELGGAFNEMAQRLQQANDAQCESEKKYRELVENANSIILKMDTEGRITYFNEYAERFFGFTSVEILGQNVIGPIVPVTESTGRNLIEMIKNIFANPDEYMHNINENICKNGERVWVSWNNHVLTDADGSKIGILSVGQDITERKRIEKELLQSEQRFRSFVENANDIVFSLTHDGIIRYVSPNWKETFGYELNETIGHPFVPFVHPDDAPGCLEFLKRIIDSGEKQSGIEYRVWHKSGGWIWNRANGSVFHDVNSNDLIFIGIGRDITELKNAEKTLRQSEEKFSAAFRASPNAITLTRQSDGVYLEVNEGFTTITGFLPEEVIGKNAAELDIWNNAQDQDELLGDLYEYGIVKNKEIKLRRKDGSIIIGLMSIRSIEINGEQCTLAVTHDVTEREYLQNELIKAQKLESISILAGGIAHNFNNVLTGVIGYISYAKKNLRDTNKVLHILDSAEKSSYRAAGLARQLLTFSQSGIPTRKPVSVDSLVEESVSLFLSASNVNGIIDCTSHQIIDVDSQQINQAFNNIVLNALQSMPDGGTLITHVDSVTLDKNNRFSLKPGKYARIVFEDSGCGIKQDDLNKVFDPYFTTKDSGTGLGLSTTHSIISKHGGHINITSEVGKGTSVTILLPSIAEDHVIDVS